MCEPVLGQQPQIVSEGDQPGDQQVLIPMANPGTWYVLVYMNQVTIPGNYILQAEVANLFISSASPGPSRPTLLHS